MKRGAKRAGFVKVGQAQGRDCSSSENWIKAELHCQKIQYDSCQFFVMVKET